MKKTKDIHVSTGDIFRKHFLRTILFGLFASSLAVAFSQSPTYLRYTVANGLPSNTVYDIAQDSQGFIWIATDAGISRFDGTVFLNYDVNDGLPDKEILKVFPDSKGRVWLLSFNGKISYYKNGRIIRQEDDPVLANLDNNAPLISAFEDSRGNIWLGCYKDRIIRIGQDAAQLISRNTCKLYGSPVKYFWEESGKVYTHADDSIGPECLPDPAVISVRKVPFCSRIGSLFSSNLSSDGNMLCGERILSFTSGRFDTVSAPIDPAPGRSFPINFYQDKSGAYWIGYMNAGLVEYNPKDTGHETRRYLKNNSVSSVLEDREGNFWFGSLVDGLFLARGRKTLSWSKKDGLPYNQIRAIGPSPWGTILVCQINGLYEIDGNRLNDLGNHPVANGLLNPRGIFRKKNGEVCVWGDNNALEFGKSNKKESIRKYNFSGLKDIAEDREGKLYFASASGVFSDENGEEQYIGVKEGLYFGIRTEKLLVDNENRLWIGTTNGLYSHEDGNLKHWGAEHDLLNDRIIDLATDAAGNLWICTATRGLGILSGVRLDRLDTTNGLSSNLCQSLYVDAAQQVWVGTSNGLNKISGWRTGKSPDKIAVFTAAVGLASNNITDIYVEGETVYAATNAGLSIFNESDQPGLQFVPPVYLTRVSVRGRDTTLLPGYTLPHYDNYLRLDFIGLSFCSAGEMKYKYRMRGIDPDWVMTRQTRVQYPSLPPGDYTFEVLAKGITGSWSETPATAHFRILKPWYATFWFIGLCIVAAAAVVGGGFYLRLRTLRQRDLYEQKVSGLRAQALGLQMNPHFIFNSLNSIHHFITGNDKDSARTYLSKFGRLIRGVLEYSNREGIPVGEELKLLDLYLALESLRLGDKLSYRLHTEKLGDLVNVEIPPMVIQPFVENAVWHGIGHKAGPGRIDVYFEPEGERLRVAVVDDGVGRAAAAAAKTRKKHTSVSSKSITERLTLLNKAYGGGSGVKIIDLQDAEGKAAGTRVELLIPVEF